MTTADATENLTYHVFVNEWPQQTNGFLPNGEPKQFSRRASTLICGSENAVLTDPGMTADQARALGDWIAEKGTKRDRHLRPDTFVTYGRGDHWFAAGLLAERFAARIYWRWRSRFPGLPDRRRHPRPDPSDEPRQLALGHPSYDGELLKLGVEMSPAPVGRYLPRRSNRPPRLGAPFCGTVCQPWPPSTRFVIATATFRLLYAHPETTGPVA